MKQFVCESCGETFDSDTEWTAQDMIDEYEQVFESPPIDAATVCDDCYELIMERAGA